MRLAYQRYSGARGFTTREFLETMQQVAGVDLSAWFASAVAILGARRKELRGLLSEKLPVRIILAAELVTRV
jgi:hypothetical protein